MKNTVIKCITALLCAAAICITASTGAGKLSDAKLSANQNNTASGNDAAADDPAFDDAFADLDAPADSSETEVNGNDDASTAPSDTGSNDSPSSTAASGANTGTPTKPAQSGNKAPSTNEEIIAYYNSAVNKVISSKAGYKKSRTTNTTSLDGGRIMEYDFVVGKVNKFLGIGTTTYENAKGKSEYFSPAALKASDVKKAVCTENGGIYTLTFELNGGKSSATASSTSDGTPIARSGLYSGKGDNIDYDYKSSENIYAAVSGLKNASVESVTASVSSAKFSVKIDSKTGKMISFTSALNWSCELTNVKYLVVTIKKGSATVATKVTYSDFKW